MSYHQDHALPLRSTSEIFWTPLSLFLFFSLKVKRTMHVPSLHLLLSVNSFICHRNQRPIYRPYIDGMIQMKKVVELPGIWYDLVAHVGKILSHNRRIMTHFQSSFRKQLQNIFTDSSRMLDENIIESVLCWCFQGSQLKNPKTKTSARREKIFRV